MPMLYSCRNQLIDLSSESANWVLFECNIGMIGIKKPEYLHLKLFDFFCKTFSLLNKKHETADVKKYI